jgi:hypothetical protein
LELACHRGEALLRHISRGHTASSTAKTKSSARRTDELQAKATQTY